jgi:isoquinoline 1-oxidoreductase subunit beta
MKKRSFLLIGTAALGALVVGWGVMPARSRLGKPDQAARALNAWIKISTDGKIVLAMPRSEMGQGTHTGLAMLVAEELNMPAAAITLEQAGNESLFGNVAMLVAGLPFHPRDGEPGHATTTVKTARWIVGKVARELGVNATGGSSSIADAWIVLRQAAALARHSLVLAGAKQLNAAPETCELRNGVVSAGGRSVNISELVGSAVTLASSLDASAITLKPASQWSQIGTAVPRLDALSKSMGTAAFGQDAPVKNALYAVVVMNPELGASVTLVDRDGLMKQPGVKAVVELSSYVGSTSGFAVVATNTYAAMAAARQPGMVRWGGGSNAQLNSVNEIKRLVNKVEGGDEGFAFEKRGDALTALKQSGSNAKVLQAWYAAPYLAHAAMEPMNATAQVTLNDKGAITRVDVWAPTQVPGFARNTAAQAANCAVELVHVHVSYLGGGFGRRLETDFIAQAVRVALVTPGQPVKLLWSREQDTQHDFYRPAQVAKCAASFIDGKLRALHIRTASDSITPYWMGRHLPALAADTPDKTSAEGLFDQPYEIEHQLIEHLRVKSSVPIGFWRSVGHSHNAFITESFIDELAHSQSIDPIAFRLSLLQTAPRHAAVLKLAADKAGWGRTLPPGHALGVALHESFGTTVAQIAQVSIQANQAIRVHRVVCAIDCGTAINPMLINQQVQSSIVFGLSAALFGRIDIVAGKVIQGNFDSYRVLRANECPEIETHIIKSNSPPTGVGEPATPPIAPAVGNALFKLTGKRLRELPLQLNA